MSETMVTALTTAFTSVKTDVLKLVGESLPVGLTIMGTMLAITLAVKFFKKVASK